MQQNSSSSKGKQQQPQVVYVMQKQKANHSLLWFILFGWWWVGWVALKWCFGVITWPLRMGARVGWLTLIEWPWRMSVAACLWSVRGVKALVARNTNSQP